jgi:hypothetical protein
MRNVSDKSCRENQNTHFIFNTPPPAPPPENRAVYNVEKYGAARDKTDDSIMWQMHTG